VLDDGEIAEFGVPHLLLQDASGHLRKLVDQTGEVEAKRLEEQALAAMNANTEGSNNNSDTSDTELEQNEPVNRTLNANEVKMDIPTIIIEGDDVDKPLLSDTGV